MDDGPAPALADAPAPTGEDGDFAARLAERRSARSLAALARDELERLILSGALPPGVRLSEPALAARLGVSRGPLREALRALEADGLVAGGGGPHRGVSVRRLDAEDLAELYDARALLQGFALARLAARADAAALAGAGSDLRARVAAMAEAAESGDGDAYYRLNLDFHEALLEAARHRRTAALYRGLLRESHLARRLVLARPENMRESNAEHAAMLDAVAARDADAARRLGEAHVLSGKRRWLASLLAGGAA